MNTVEEHLFGDNNGRVNQCYGAGVIAPGHHSLVDAGQAVKQIAPIKDVGEQFLCRLAQHDGGYLGPGCGFYAGRKAGAREQVSAATGCHALAADQHAHGILMSQYCNVVAQAWLRGKPFRATIEV